MDDATLTALLAADARHVWHPYAALPAPVESLLVERAEGVRLHMADGRALIDGMASWWCAIHGYRHPKLVAAMHAQIDRMSHVMFGGLTHEPAVRLVERLVELTPEALDAVFLCDSGSVSVEIAIKMALQAALGRGESARRRLLTVRGGYHGDTFMAMSVCDPVTGMHSLFRGALPEQVFVETPRVAFGAPWAPEAMEPLERALHEHGRSVAAMILEPVVQGAGGMRFYHPEYLRRARDLCDAHGVLLIFDEIATGFGRTGKLFALEHADVVPDILCVGKALTGGTLSLAATVATRAVADAIDASPPGVLNHGPTFMGNPLACAAALASLDLLASSPWAESVARIERQLTEELAPARGRAGVRDVRVLGAIGVIELDEPVSMPRVQPALVERGVWLRPFGRLLYTMPPYVIDATDLGRVTSAMVELAAP